MRWTLTAEERFWSYIKINEANGCWEWQGSKVGQKKSEPSTGGTGHGSFYYEGKLWLAHRWSYAFIGKMPLESSELVLHKCDNPPCCNPEHLYVGTFADNSRDIVTRGRHRRVGGRRRSITENEIRLARDILCCWPVDVRPSQSTMAKLLCISQNAVSKLTRFVHKSDLK